MKKYNRIILMSVLLYLILAAGAGYGIRRIKAQSNTVYKVEINRIYNSLSGGLKPDKLDLRSYRWVKEVTCLPVSELGQEDRAKEFFQEQNEWKMLVKPIYRDGQLKSYVRFDYAEPDTDMTSVLLYVEIILGVMELMLLIVLFYLKYKLLQPFWQMAEMPYELAQGHLKGFVKEEKNKFFGKFLWGIGQLKDTLDISRKRTLQLEKEKKTLLLSLSHDIKTPLNTIKLYAKALEENLYTQEGQRTHAAHQIGVKTKEIEKYVEEIMKNSREDILDFHVINQEFYLEDLMTKILHTYKEKCEVRMIELHVEKYENRLLKGDLDRTLEVFENIFENAFKYGDGRTIEITFYEEDDCQLIRIFNTGIPVTENDFNHIFESFFRAGNSEGQPGNGLGLYICREIMRKMGGSIFAEIEKDGMAFVLVFE